MSTLTLVAYHNDQQIKSEILTQLARHRAADDLMQGYGYWENGKGCAVGCTIHSGDHIEYEARFGIPVAIARLEDSIFDGLSIEAARAWPERLMSSILPGQDLSRVHWALLHWLLTDETINPGINHPTVRHAVRQCADMISVLNNGGAVSVSAAKSAADRAVSAARSAERAAESAAWLRISDKLIELIEAAPMAMAEDA